MDKQRPVRVGTVGCGYQGGMMAQAIGRTESLQVTARADPNQTAAAHVARLVSNAATYASIEALLGKRRWMPSSSPLRMMPCMKRR